MRNALKPSATTDERAMKKLRQVAKEGRPVTGPGDKRNIQGQINRPCGFDCFQIRELSDVMHGVFHEYALDPRKRERLEAQAL